MLHSVHIRQITGNADDTVSPWVQHALIEGSGTGVTIRLSSQHRV